MEITSITVPCPRYLWSWPMSRHKGLPTPALLSERPPVTLSASHPDRPCCPRVETGYCHHSLHAVFVP